MPLPLVDAHDDARVDHATRYNAHATVCVEEEERKGGRNESFGKETPTVVSEYFFIPHFRGKFVRPNYARAI